MCKMFGVNRDHLANIIKSTDKVGGLTEKAAAELGLAEGTPITYRGGDQPNNALSLNVFNPGEIASTAGTSGVVYGSSSVYLLSLSNEAEKEINATGFKDLLKIINSVTEVK